MTLLAKTETKIFLEHSITKRIKGIQVELTAHNWQK